MKKLLLFCLLLAGCTEAFADFRRGIDEQRKWNFYSTSFDGTTESAESDANVSQFDGIAKMTWSAWVKPTSVQPAASDVIAGRYGGAGARSWLVTGLNNNGAARVYYSTDGTNLALGDTGTDVFVVDQWVHLCGWYCGDCGAGAADRMRLWVNGVEDTLGYTSTPPATLPSITYELEVGSRQNGTNQWLGSIDQVTIWIASNESCTEIYANGRPGAPINDPEFHYNMGDGDTYSVITDRGSAGVDLNMKNMDANNFALDVPQ